MENDDDENVYGACRPLPGQTYLAIGQDLFSIEEYLREQYNASLHEYLRLQQTKNTTNNRANPLPQEVSSSSFHDVVPTRESVLPAAVMFYTDLPTLAGLLDGRPADYGSGIEYANGLLELVASYDSLQRQQQQQQQQQPAASVALQIGLWLNGTTGCANLVAGRWDAQLQTLFQYLMLVPSQPQPYWKKTFLRVGYEFDNPAFGYAADARLYRAAFRYVVHSCHAWYTRRVCAQHIAFVWHSWAAGGLPPNKTLNDYYPGDDCVDWIGVSVFSQLQSNSTTGLGHRETVTQVLDFASASHSPSRRNGMPNHSLPVMIAESTPFGGLDHFNDPWKDWFEPVLQLLDDYPSIGMWSYINCDWDDQPMWHGVGFGDTRLSTNATIMALWQQHVLHHPRFVPITSTCGTTTTPTTTESTTITYTSTTNPKTTTNPMESSYSGILMPLYNAIKRHTRRRRQQRQIRSNNANDGWTSTTEIGTAGTVSVVVVVLVVPLFLMVAIYHRRRHRRRGRVQLSGRNHDAPFVNHPPAMQEPPQSTFVKLPHESRIHYYGSLSEQ